MKTINIKCAEDFNILRTYERYTPLLPGGVEGVMNLQINILDDIEFNDFIKPLKLEKYNIIINGNNKTIKNLCISEKSRRIGLFASVNTILVNNLNIADSYIRGGLMSGSIVGECKHEAIFKNVSFVQSIVDSSGYSGGLVGKCKDGYVENSIVESFITGVDVVGGFIGCCDENYNEKNSLKNPKLISLGNNIDESVGLCKNKIIKDDDGRKFRRHNY